MSVANLLRLPTVDEEFTFEDVLGAAVGAMGSAIPIGVFLWIKEVATSTETPLLTPFQAALVAAWVGMILGIPVGVIAGALARPIGRFT